MSRTFRVVCDECDLEVDTTDAGKVTRTVASHFREEGHAARTSHPTSYDHGVVSVCAEADCRLSCYAHGTDYYDVRGDDRHRSGRGHEIALVDAGEGEVLTDFTDEAQADRYDGSPRVEEVRR